MLEFGLEFNTQQLPERGFALVGYSYGGYLARGIIHQWSDKVSGLCLIAPRIMQDRKNKSVPEHTTLFVEPGFHEYLAPDDAWTTEYLVEQTREGLEVMRQHVFPSLELYDEARSDRMNQFRPGLSFDVDDLASPFGNPTLIIKCQQDSVTGYQDDWRLLEK